VSVVPQSCDRSDPAVVVKSRMQHMDMFNNTIMNKSMSKGVKDDGAIITTTTTTIIITTIASIITPIAIIITIIVAILHQIRPVQFNRIVLQPNNHIDPTMMMMTIRML